MAIGKKVRLASEVTIGRIMMKVMKRTYERSCVSVGSQGEEVEQRTKDIDHVQYRT